MTALSQGFFWALGWALGHGILFVVALALLSVIFNMRPKDKQ